MAATNISSALRDAAVKSARFMAIELTVHQVSDDVERLLHAIAAPADLAGFYHVAQSLVKLAEDADSKLLQVLNLKPYLVAALLNDLEANLSRADALTYKKHTTCNFWAKQHSLYLLLFVGSALKDTAEDRRFMHAFILHFITDIDVLTAADIQPSTRTRVEEVCRAMRILQEKSQTSFSTQQIAGAVSDWYPSEIASALQQLLDRAGLDKKSTGYVRKLVKFFGNDWGDIKRTGKIGPQKNKRTGGGSRVSVRPEVIISKPSTVPPMITADEQGVVTQDIEILRTHISNNLEDEDARAKADRNSIGAIFDASVQKLGAINLTRALRQKNNLNLSSRLLLARGSIHLIKNICESRLTSTDQNDVVLAIYCMLSTGISLAQLAKLKISYNRDNPQNGIFVTSGACFWKFKHRVSAITPVGQPENFYTSDEWVFTPCSALLSCYIKRHYAADDSEFLATATQLLQKRIDKFLQRSTERLKVPYISTGMLEDFVLRFTEASDSIDPIVLDLSYQQECYSTRVSRSYVNLTDTQRLDMLCLLWRDIAGYAADDSVAAFFQPASNMLSPERRVGSRYVPTTSFCQRFISDLQECVIKAKPGISLKLVEIVRYHNAYIRYTAWMLGFGTGYRAVYNPLPTLTQHIPALNLLSISDKDDSAFSHSRVVAVPQTLNQHLQYVASHLVRLAELLTTLAPNLYHKIRNIFDAEQQLKLMTPAQLKAWFLDLRNARNLYGPFFYLDDELNANPVSPKWLKSDNGSFNSVPVNMGRHWLKTTLLTAGVSSELVNFQLGHWQEGQSPLFENSSMSMMESASVLWPIIDQKMINQGWCAWKSDFL